MTTPGGRDPNTGELINKIGLNIHRSDQPFPMIGYCADWTEVRKFLGSAEFRRIANVVTYITITNRDAGTGRATS